MQSKPKSQKQRPDLKGRGINLGFVRTAARRHRFKRYLNCVLIKAKIVRLQLHKPFVKNYGWSW